MMPGCGEEGGGRSLAGRHWGQRGFESLQNCLGKRGLCMNSPTIRIGVGVGSVSWGEAAMRGM